MISGEFTRTNPQPLLRAAGIIRIVVIKLEGKLKNIQQITMEIFEAMPVETRFSPDDAAVINQYKNTLLGLENQLVQGFYDTLYNHRTTYEILSTQDRKKREQVLSSWWQKTLNSDFGPSYWEWQVSVGLTHIKHKVSNPMMISMWGWLLIALRTMLKEQLEIAEVDTLMHAFEKLATTIQALTSESFLSNYIQALQLASGFNNKLIEKMVALHIDGMLRQREDY